MPLVGDVLIFTGTVPLVCDVLIIGVPLVGDVLMVGGAADDVLMIGGAVPRVGDVLMIGGAATLVGDVLMGSAVLHIGRLDV